MFQLEYDNAFCSRTSHIWTSFRRNNVKNPIAGRRFLRGSAAWEGHVWSLVGEFVQSRVVDNSVMSLVTSFEHYNTWGIAVSSVVAKNDYTSWRK